MAQQLASRGQPPPLLGSRLHPCRQALRPRSCSRSTAVRCFKGSYDNGAKPSTTLRLNFKIPYRVNYGQTVGLVGSGDTLGNWDPKRTVPMKWTDGDWWTVELTVAPGTSTLDLEYKYVVVNSDGNIGYWKPGGNYRVTLPLPSGGSKVPKRVKVADAWDDSFKKVDVEEVEAMPGPGSNGVAAPGKPPVQPQQAQQQAQGLAQQPPRAGVPSAQPAPAPSPQAAAAQAAAAPPRAADFEPAAARTPPAPSAPVSAPFTVEVRPSQTVPPPSAGPKVGTGDQAAGQMKASSNGAASSSPLPAKAAASTSVPPPPTQQPQVSPPPPPPPPPQAQAQPQSQPEPSPRPQNGAPPRSASPRMTPSNFAAATTIPAIHPSLLAEQDRLEDGVRNSLEDLQTQMDKHQQLRERTDEAKLAAAEATSARLAETVEALTKEVASLREQLTAMRELFTGTVQALTDALQRQQPGLPGAGPTQQVIVTAGQPFGFPFPGALGGQTQQPDGWWPPTHVRPMVREAERASAVPVASEAAVSGAVPVAASFAEAETALPSRQAADSSGPAWLSRTMVPEGIAQAAAAPLASRMRSFSQHALRTVIRRSPVAVRAASLGRGTRAPTAPAAVNLPVGEPRAPPPAQLPQSPQPPAPQLVSMSSPAQSPVGAGVPQQPVTLPLSPPVEAPAQRVRSSAKRAGTLARAPPKASETGAASAAAALVPVVCGVGRGAHEGARGHFNVQAYREAERARAKVAHCIELQAVKRQGVWADVAPRMVTPLEFVQEGGLRGKNWKGSIRVLENGAVGLPLGDFLAQVTDRVGQ